MTLLPNAGLMNGEGDTDRQTSLRWWEAFQEASASARSCGDEFDDLFNEGRTQAARLGWSLVACLVWILVLLELGVQSLLSGLLLLLSPLLRSCFAVCAPSFCAWICMCRGDACLLPGCLQLASAQLMLCCMLLCGNGSLSSRMTSLFRPYCLAQVQ